MPPDLVQVLVNGGGFAVMLWMLNNVWAELKVSNERIYQLLIDRDQAAQERADMKAKLDELGTK